MLLASSIWAEDIIDGNKSAVLVPQLPSTVNIYTYHNQPPYIIDANDRKGLLFDFLNELQDAAPKVTFVENVVSRSKVNDVLDSNQPSIVMWVNPDWFVGVSQSLYWSKQIFESKSVFVFLKDKGVKYKTTEDLEGLVFGSRKGYSSHYISQVLGFEPIKQVAAASAGENVANLLKGEVDFIVLPQVLGLNYFRSKNLIEKIQVHDMPVDSLPIYIMVSHSYLELLPVVNNAIDKLNKSEAWQSKLHFYGLVTNSTESH